MTTLVLLDHDDDGTPRPAALELVTAARPLGEVHGVWVGDGLDAALPGLADAGVLIVHRLPADVWWPAALAEALHAVRSATGADLVLLASTSEGKEVAAGLAVLDGAAVVTDAERVERVEGALRVTKSVLAGTWVSTVEVTSPVAVVTLEPNAVRAEPAAAPSSPQVVDVQVAVSELARSVTVVRTPRQATGRPDLATADVVVVAGRGVDGHLSPVEELADLLGGAVGATRVVADEGWLPREQQVGQTGVAVAPRLYIGVGVSGAVHHRGGMQSAGTVVAVNSDPDAPIFEFADYGIVGDLFDVLPALTAELRRLRELA
ncbi:MAG: electron transfer flavoprotein subunit alpha/FixB family protein [Actinobacteria bacterium]|nr:electron transfer flavoprotein subunit alpha/FixB family protein [Actinomycetota bacterium]MCG2801621.1 electron transfer flavoprotein subunit alpha/FixB family protein [Cellulomonas sp.]